MAVLFYLSFFPVPRSLVCYCAHGPYVAETAAGAACTNFGSTTSVGIYTGFLCTAVEK